VHHLLRRFENPCAEIRRPEFLAKKSERTQNTPRAFTPANRLNEYLHRIDQLETKRVGDRAALPNSASASKVTHRASPSAVSPRARFDASDSFSPLGRNLSRAKLFLHQTPAHRSPIAWCQATLSHAQTILRH
jgi:hypothetical protein